MRHLTLVVGALLFGTVSFSQSKKKTPSTDSSLVAGSSIIKIPDEPKFIISVHSGYAVALGSTFKFYPDDITRIAVNMPAGGGDSKEVTSKAATKGLGQGFRYGAGISYIINDFINVGMDFDYFSSTISKSRDSSFQGTKMTSNGMQTNTFDEHYVISYNTRLLTITPNITFKAISRPKFFIYNKVGMIMTFRPNSIQKESQKDSWTTGWQGYYKDSSSSTNTRYEWGIKNPALGFMGAIGAQVRILERVRVFGEVQFSHIVFVVRNRVLTSLNVNGKETVNTLPVSMRDIEFKTSLTSDALNADPNQPSEAITQKFPLTYVGLQLGLSYRF